METSTMADEGEISHEEMHRRIHEQHAGHETMHTVMFLMFIFTMAFAQVCLFEWKRRHFRSFQMATLIGMWLIPVIFCIYFGWWRFNIIWFIFSLITMFVVKQAARKPVVGRTPRLVYTWFILIYKATYGLGLLGYFILLLTMLGVFYKFEIKPSVTIDISFLCVFYGLYYGVLSRDFAEICTDRMAVTIGYYSPTGMPIRQLEPNVCAVCGNGIVWPNDENASRERSYQLACSHRFHEFCIRGWCIIGKKQTCPYCKEKVDLKRMFSNPWEKPHVLYGQMLDCIRYLLAWQPLIMTIVKLLIWIFGLE